MSEDTSVACLFKKKETMDWINRFILGLEICPFAKHPVHNNLLRLHCLKGTDTLVQLSEATKIIGDLMVAQPTEWSTSFLLFAHHQPSFAQLLDFISVQQEVLVSREWEAHVQLVPFHPSFQFEGLSFEDKENILNRSPYPMIHILRQAEVSRASDQIGDLTAFLARNREKVQKLDRPLY
ncbi:MAG: DUF1415 domain-containing protein [Saprospiraceae bacterium]|nr:DUF1415 domain-containing protein [Saprospiraceae bacterium]